MITHKLKEKFVKNFYENNAWNNNQVICGIDEVGRGCLGGPVVTAAVILPPHIPTRNLKDSKIMSKQELQTTATWLKPRCWYSYGIIHHRLIDQHNIWQATLMAMKRALMNLLAVAQDKPQLIVVDAMPLNLSDTSFNNIDVYHFPFGEKRSSSIAAASILAKVKRDEMLAQLDPLFPAYHFAKHKGYATAEHRSIIKKVNHSIIHRKSFLTLEASSSEDTYDEQQTLW